MFKKVISSVLTIAMMFTMSASVFASEEENQYPTISYQEVVNARDNTSEEFQMIEVNGIDVVSRGLNECLEYAYTYNGSVYTYIFRNGVLTESLSEVIVMPEKITMTEQEKQIVSEAWKHSEYTVDSVNKNLQNSGIASYAAQDIDGALCIVPVDPNPSTYANSKTYNNYKELVAKYPAKNASSVQTGTFYCSGLNKYVPISIRDTISSHTITEYQPHYWKIGMTAVTEIAKAAVARSARSAVKALVQAFIDTLGEFIADVTFNAGNAATTSNLRQAFVNDTTNYNRYVSVYTTYGTQEYSFSDQNSGYDWGYIAPKFFDESNPISDVRSEGERIYNFNIDEYGIWKWGDV